MIYPIERLKEMSSTVDHSILVHILEEQQKQTALLEKLAGVSKEVKSEEKQKRPYNRKEG